MLFFTGIWAAEICVLLRIQNSHIRWLSHYYKVILCHPAYLYLLRYRNEQKIFSVKLSLKLDIVF